MSFSPSPTKETFADKVGFGKRFTMGKPNEYGDARKLFVDLGFEYVNSRDPKDFDFVVLSGGADICPLIYGQVKILGTNYDLERDLMEINLIKRLPAKMPKIGICRGGQLLNVLNGGSMWQDVDRHIGTKHNAIISKTGEVVEVNSVHHQMMRPSDIGHVILKADTVATVRYDDEGKNKREETTEQWIEPECIFYTHTKSLCFQPHPEYGHAPTLDIFSRLVRGLYPKVTTVNPAT